MMLLIDMNNLCMREAFAKAGLTHRGQPSGVIYGALQQLRMLMGRFPGEVCCCWDAPRKTLLRRKFWPGYKSNRDDREPSEAALDAYPQMALLREELLPRLGLPNQMLQEGYEADDLIGALYAIPTPMKVIVSSDNDLYQLLGPRCHVYNLDRKANYTYQDLLAEHGVLPGQWPEVKAIAGDSSDGINGVPGVGVKTAAKWLRGGGHPHAGNGISKKVRLAIAVFTDLIARNRILVRLPWPGCDPGPVKPSWFDEREFMRICAEWGLRSLAAY